MTLAQASQACQASQDPRASMASILERRKLARPKEIGLPVIPIPGHGNDTLASRASWVSSASSGPASSSNWGYVAELDAPDCDGAPEQWVAELRWAYNPDTAEQLPSPSAVMHLHERYADLFWQASRAGLSMQTINCATAAFALSSFPKSRLLGAIQVHSRTEAGDLFYQPFKLTSAEKDIGWRQGGDNTQHMWGVHATSQRSLAYILRDGIKAVPSEHGGALFVTVVGMRRSWDQQSQFHIKCAPWIRKCMTSSNKLCNVLVEVAWAGVQGDTVIGSCATEPGQDPMFRQRKGPGSAYLIHPCDLVITGLWYVNKDLKGSDPNTAEWSR